MLSNNKSEHHIREIDLNSTHIHDELLNYLQNPNYLTHVISNFLYLLLKPKTENSSVHAENVNTTKLHVHDEIICDICVHTGTVVLFETPRLWNQRDMDLCRLSKNL